MVIKAINKIVHMRRFRRGARRSLAAALCLALVLPMTSSFAADIMLFPLQVKQATADEFPDIEVEGNFVRDEFGFLTGYYELGLRVKTPEKGVFTGLSVALQYDASILTPVDWSETGADVPIDGMGYYGVQLPTQKLESISTAAAHSGIPAAQGGSDGTTGDSGTTTTTVGKKALLSFAINSYDPVAFPGDTSDDSDVPPDATTLAVVRFRVKKEVMDNISITKTSTGDYEVKCGEKKVTNIDELLKAFQDTSALDGVGTGEALVAFTPDDDIKKAGDESRNADAQMALDYRGGFEEVSGDEYINEYYHIPEYKPGDTTTYTTNVSATIEGKSYTFAVKPNTANNLVLAVDPDCPNADTDTAWGAEKFSYISNLIVNTADHKYITFPIVSKKSFTAQGDQLGNLTTIVYVDWDNTLLGTQVVPKNVDIRQLVSDHVAEHFIYHDDDNVNYGANDLNNPLKATDPEKTVSSLKRIDNYRGKYTANGPAAEGTPDSTVVPDGGKYPLTNKLDYVFLKRPMTHTNAYEDDAANPKKPDPGEEVGGVKKYPDGVTDKQYIADLKAYNEAYSKWYWGKTEWSQKVDEKGTAIWDTERPYAYGWAECTIDNFEDVWTTLGMGELGSAAATSEPNAKGATKGYSGANTGGYQAIPSTSVASVTYDGDADFAFADLSKGFDKSTVFLKAVYEPGEGLLPRSSYYRMVQKPYYNKFNSKRADDGGAYMVSASFERAAVGDDGKFAGIARIREPVVRQDTTTDLKWEESTTPLVSHDLANATWEDTYGTQSKTTYTKVDVTNDEEIYFEMAFSARQNKVGFFLEENYGMNFVTAGAKTRSNDARTDISEYVVDNYNYYVNDTTKIPSEYYAPTVYADREGTYGFVLFGTLNYLMEQATIYANGGMTDAVFRDIVENALTDANLKDSSGNPISGYGNITTLMETLKKAAQEAETHKKAADEADYWNADRDCAELTYHQLQHYMNNPGAGLLSRSVADDASHKIKWCHLHAACAALQSGKPRDWPSLIAAAGEGSNSKIEQLNPNEIEDTFHLRKDSGGTAGWTSSDFATAMIGAVDKLKKAGIAEADITWDQVQYVLDKGVADQSAADMNDYGAANYWWYDGDSGETAEDFTGLIQVADAAHTSPVKAHKKLPDDRAVSGRTAKLIHATQSIFPAATDVNTPNANWVTITENLTMGENTADSSKVDPFHSYNDDGDANSFVSKLVAAVNATTTAAADPTWAAVQYAILHNSAPADGEPELSKYWWHNAGINLTDLASLLRAAKNGGTTWNNIAFTAVDNMNLGLAADLAGTAITSDNFATVKAKIAAYAKREGADLTNSAWDDVQYYIIHNDFDTTYRDAEKPYYWWFPGTGENARPKAKMTTFTPTSTATDAGEKNKALADDLARLLSEAYFRFGRNGYADGEVDWNDLQDSDLKAGRLVSAMGTNFNTDFTFLTLPGGLTALKSAMATAFDAANGGAEQLNPSYSSVESKFKPYTPFTWEQLQGTLISGATEMWWKEKDTNVNKAQLLDNIQKAFAAYLADRSDANLEALQKAFTLDIAKDMGFYNLDGDAPLSSQDEVDNVNNTWGDAIDNADAGALDAPLSWSQIQILIIMGDGTWLPTSDDCDTILSDDFGITTPDWAVGGSYSLRPMMAMRLTPEQLRQQQTQDATDYQTALTEALGEDPALAAAMAENADYMDSLKALAEALGFELTAKTENKTENKTYDKDQDVVIHETNTATEDQTVTNEADETIDDKTTDDKTTDDKTTDDKTYDQTKDVTVHEIDGGDAQEKRQEQKEQQTAEASSTEKKITTGNATTTVDNTAALNGGTGEKQQPEVVAKILTTNTDNRTPETGQGDVSILDTSQPGVDPPEIKPPKIIGLVYIEGIEKSTEGVHVA